jgi:RNA polymerase sigma-70 factor (ECF subfamily)
MMSRSELERVYDAHADAAFGLFLNFARSDADARDLLQDWLVKIGRGLDSLADIKNERAYLLRIAYRLAVDWSRRQQTRRKYHEAAGEEATIRTRFAPETDPDRERLRAELENSLSQLPSEQRLAVELKLWDGLTFAEIAGVLEISPNTAASRYRYGIDKLREQLRPFYEELKES